MSIKTDNNHVPRHTRQPATPPKPHAGMPGTDRRDHHDHKNDLETAVGREASEPPPCPAHEGQFKMTDRIQCLTGVLDGQYVTF
jgi:hypothetical protein